VGHDIRGYKMPMKIQGAYYRELDPDHLIYRLLSAEFADRGVSGDGSYWCFEKEDIEAALKRLGTRKDLAGCNAHDFLKACLKQCRKAPQSVLINFG